MPTFLQAHRLFSGGELGVHVRFRLGTSAPATRGRTLLSVFTTPQTTEGAINMKHLFGAVAASLTLLVLLDIAAHSNALLFESGPV